MTAHTLSGHKRVVHLGETGITLWSYKKNSQSPHKLVTHYITPTPMTAQRLTSHQQDKQQTETKHTRNPRPSNQLPPQQQMKTWSSTTTITVYYRLHNNRNGKNKDNAPPIQPYVMRSGQFRKPKIIAHVCRPPHLKKRTSNPGHILLFTGTLLQPASSIDLHKDNTQICQNLRQPNSEEGDVAIYVLPPLNC